jgi:hypothetical protein
VLILGAAHLRAVLAEYQEHYNAARPHQGIDQRTPDRNPGGVHGAAADLDSHRIPRKPVLNGLINETCEPPDLLKDAALRPESNFRAAQVGVTLRRPVLLDAQKSGRKLRSVGTKSPAWRADPPLMSFPASRSLSRPADAARSRQQTTNKRSKKA